jgi:hypothetical protein
MRPSIRKGAHVVLSSAAWQEIRVRFGRDDTSVSVEELFQDKFAELQIPPLRYASVGMTKGRVVLSLSFAMWDGEQQVPPLRFAPVGMTKEEGGAFLELCGVRW